MCKRQISICRDPVHPVYDRWENLIPTFSFHLSDSQKYLETVISSSFWLWVDILYIFQDNLQIVHFAMNQWRYIEQLEPFQISWSCIGITEVRSNTRLPKIFFIWKSWMEIQFIWKKSSTFFRFLMNFNIACQNSEYVIIYVKKFCTKIIFFQLFISTPTLLRNPSKN